jgi:hypothetical protein
MQTLCETYGAKVAPVGEQSERFGARIALESGIRLPAKVRGRAVRVGSG